MRLSETRRAEEQEILVAVNPAAFGEFIDRPLGDALDPFESEVLKLLGDREMGHGEIAFQAVVPAVAEFGVNEGVQEGLVGQTFCLRPLDKRRKTRRGAAKAQGC